MAAPREDWDRLASYVVSARIDAGYPDQLAFAAATGITERTLGKLERGQRVSPATLATVAKKVGWTPDSPHRILEGTEPLPASRREAAPAPLPPVSGDGLDDGEGPIPAEMLYVLRTDADARLFWRLQKDGRLRPRRERIALIRFMLQLDSGGTEPGNEQGNGHAKSA